MGGDDEKTSLLLVYMVDVGTLSLFDTLCPNLAFEDHNDDST